MVDLEAQDEVDLEAQDAVDPQAQDPVDREVQEGVCHQEGGRGQPNRGCGRQPPQPPPNPNYPPQPPNPNPPQPPNPNPPQPPNPNPPQPPNQPVPPGMGAIPAPGAPNKPTDPGIVAILNRLVHTQEKQANDKNESKRFTQFPTVKFDGSVPEKSLDHWNIFMQYWIYVLGKGYVPWHTDPNYYTIFCQQFILTLTGIAYTWFKQIQDNFNDINDVKAAFLKCFNEWGQTVKQHMTAWNSLRFDVQQHDMDVFTRKLRLLASILYMTDDQTVEKFKDLFDTNIAAHLIKCETLAEAREKAEQLVFLYKNTAPASATTVLLHENSPDTKELKEHQLAPVPKADKKGQNQEIETNRRIIMILPGAKTPHFNGDNQDSAQQGEDQTKEVVSSEVEGANNMVKSSSIFMFSYRRSSSTKLLHKINTELGTVFLSFSALLLFLCAETLSYHPE